MYTLLIFLSIQSLGCELGIAHPPGYPLYTLFIAGLRLIHSYVGTSQELAYFVNVSSTVFTILAAYFIGSSVELSSFKTSNNKDFGTRLDTSLSILFAMLLFTFSPLIWQYSTTAEVFPMNTFFASLLIYLVLLFSSTRSVGVAYIGAFVCGLALCNQHTILLLELHLVVWVLYLLRPQVYTNPIILLNLSALFMLGLTPYVYLPLAGWYNPTGGSWGHPSTWSGFINHILRRDYGTFSVYSGNTSHISNMERFLMRAKLYIEDLCFQQGLYVVPILAVVGIAVQWKWSKTTVKQISNTMTLPSARAKIRDKNTSEASSSSSSSTDSANIDTVKSTKKSTTPVRRKSIKGSVTKKQALSTSSTSTQLLSSLSLPSSNISVLQVIQTAVAVTSSVVVSGSEAVYTLTVLFISYSFYLLVFHSLSNLPLSETLLYAIHQRFWMQPNVLVFYWSGVGLFSLFQAARKVLKTIANYDNIESGGINCGQNSNNSNTVLATSKPSKPPSIIIIESIFNLFISLLVLLAIYRQYHTWLPVSDQHKATYFRQYAHSVLAPLPLNAVLFINYDQQWSSVRYIQQCLHIRPDITTINLSMMSYPWFTYKQSLFPHLKFPGNYLTSPHSATIHTENAFTFLSFLHANIKQHKVFLGGELNYADPQLFEEFSLVPVGLVSQFIPVTKASNASVYLTQFKRNIKTVLSQLHTLPDPEQYSSNTWEWTIDRDFKDRIGCKLLVKIFYMYRVH